MKADWYIRSVLTIIALCLVWSSLADRLSTGHVEAQGLSRVVIVGIEGLDALPVRLIKEADPTKRK